MSTLQAPIMRLAHFGSSPIRQLSEQAPPDCIPLGLGEPSWPSPLPELGGDERPLSYGPNAGLAELRQVLARRYRVPTEGVGITCGATGALHALFSATLAPGDCVLVPNPGFPGYTRLAQLCHAQALPYPLLGHNGYQPDLEACQDLLAATPNARILVINQPSNPTGCHLSATSTQQLLRLAETRNLLLVCDEVYRELSTNRPQPALEPSNWLVQVSSMSKAWAAPGLRIGWMAGPPQIIQPAIAAHATTATTAPLNNQRLALHWLKHADAGLASSSAHLKARLNICQETCRHHWGWLPTLPEAGFYLWLAVPDALSDWDFCRKMREEARVLLVPGSCFGSLGNGFLRLSLAARPQEIAEGIRRLAPWFAR
jgi:aspartate/methionine/tyrosine aminotransferase